MDRRTVIKNLALVIGGTVLLPSCLHRDGFSYIQLKHIKLDQGQEALIADICETIIPKTKTPGAKDLNLPQFVLKMLDDCYNKKDQLAFATGLEEFKNQVSKKYNKDFSDLDVKDKEVFLTAIEVSSKPKISETKAAPPINNSKPQKGVDVPSVNAKPKKEADVFAYAFIIIDIITNPGAIY